MSLLNLLGVQLLLYVFLISPDFAVAQPNSSRFPKFSECLDNDHSAGNGSDSKCITCDAVVQVSLLRGPGCPPQGTNLAGRVCDDLDQVLESILLGHTIAQVCIEVLIFPKSAGGAAYMVWANKSSGITQNVVLRGMSQLDPVVITFAEPIRASGGDNGDNVGGMDSIYGVNFNNSGTVVLSNLRFIGSPGILGFNHVQVVVIESCTFRFFNKGAVDIYNSLTVLIYGSNFSHNVVFNISKTQAYRGHSAGLSIGYDVDPTSTIGPFVRVSNCKFQNNSVESTPIGSTEDEDQSGFGSSSFLLPGVNNNSNNNNNNKMNNDQPKMSVGKTFESNGQIFSQHVFVGRGGGMALIINRGVAADVVMWGVRFLENSAFNFGGGLYVLLQGPTSHSVTINQSRFVRNMSPSTGGGLHTTFLVEGAESEFHRIFVYGTIFNRNQAQYGGGGFFLPLGLTLQFHDESRIGAFGHFESCVFSNNMAQEAGGGLGVAFNIQLFGHQHTPPMEIVDCIFMSNAVSGAGIVSTAFFPVSFYGRNLFKMNSGSCLAVIGSLVRVHGTLVLRDNININSLDGGSFYITSMGQVELQTNTSLLFRSNTGIFGAAIVIRNLQLSKSLSQLKYNPLCSFLFSERSLPPDRWSEHNVSVTVVRNYAVVAAGAYLNNMDLCSWESNTPPYFNRRAVFRWNYIHYMNNSNTAHGDPNNARFMIQTPPVRVALNDKEVTAFPGQQLNLSVFAFDELEVPTSAVVGYLDDSASSISLNSEDVELYRFSPSSVTLRKVTRNAVVSLIFGTLDNSSSYHQEKIIVRTLGETRNAEATFVLSPIVCPAGHVLKTSSFSNFSICVCDNERKDILNCDDRAITMKGIVWGYTVADMKAILLENIPLTSTQTANPFYTNPCPSRYCSCEVDSIAGVSKCNFIYDRMSPNSQCQCNRTGILCGDCMEGSGFSTLLNTCVSCDNRYGLFLLALTVVDCIIIFILLVIMLPIPTWVYPTIFYLQILPHLTQHFPVTFDKMSPYMAYIGSALGLYFPYDICLHSKMSAYGVYALRYIPALLVVVIAPVFLYIRSKCFRHCDWHGLWFLVLLLYTPILHTSMALLDCTSLKGESSFTPRWFVNANIRCFQDAEHAPLALFALAIVLFAIVLIPLLTLVAIQRLKRPYWVQSLVTPLTCPFKDKYAWWCGVELSKRVLLVFFSIYFKDNVREVAMFLAVILALNGFFKPYKSMVINILDIFYGVDIFIMLCMRSTIGLEDMLQVFPEHDTQRRSMTLDSDMDVQEYTNFTIMLASFYYLPVALAFALMVIYLGRLIHSLVQNDFIPIIKKWKKKEENLERPRSSLSQSDSEQLHKRTQTVIDPSTYNMVSPSVEKSGIKQFSFSTRKHFSSRKQKKAGTLLSHKSGDVALPGMSGGSDVLALQEISECVSNRERMYQTKIKHTGTEAEGKTFLVESTDLSSLDSSIAQS